jgi:hypothetical protein
MTIVHTPCEATIRTTVPFAEPVLAQALSYNLGAGPSLTLLVPRDMIGSIARRELTIDIADERGNRLSFAACRMGRIELDLVKFVWADVLDGDGRSVLPIAA